MNKYNPLIKALSITLVSFVPVAALAQQLPNIQQTSQRAPAGIKIDGKPSEWHNKFGAYNKNTGIFYTIANDDDNLYLIIKAANKAIIYNGGFTFTVNQPGKKEDKQGIGITYPVFNSDNEFRVNINNKPAIIPGSASSIMKADSFMNANNEQLAAKTKGIKVTGIKGVKLLIPAENEYGIKAAALFDNQMAYIMEIAIPLRYMYSSAIDPANFVYHVQLNQIKEAGPGIQGLMPIADFWGEYAWAKK